MSRLSERIENFNSFFKIFSDAVNAYNKNNSDVLTHMALIQSFEVCFELSWKVLKDYLKVKGLNVYLPKDVIKDAFANEVITNGQVWIDMLDARNSISHEYNLDKVNLIIQKISSNYYDEISKFAEQVKDFHE